jgi:hypothetical protein
MGPIAAIWHYPGATPSAQGAGTYPVAIISFIDGPSQTIGGAARAIIVDVSGRLNTAAINELEIVEPAVRAAVDRAYSTKP